MAIKKIKAKAKSLSLAKKSSEAPNAKMIYPKALSEHKKIQTAEGWKRSIHGIKGKLPKK